MNPRRTLQYIQNLGNDFGHYSTLDGYRSMTSKLAEYNKANNIFDQMIKYINKNYKTFFKTHSELNIHVKSILYFYKHICNMGFCKFLHLDELRQHFINTMQNQSLKLLNVAFTIRKLFKRIRGAQRMQTYLKNQIIKIVQHMIRFNTYTPNIRVDNKLGKDPIITTYKQSSYEPSEYIESDDISTGNADLITLPEMYYRMGYRGSMTARRNYGDEKGKPIDVGTLTID